MASNEGHPATIVAHSLGCLVSLSFLTGKPAGWLAKHVSSLVAISAPWAGSVTALKGTTPGFITFFVGCFCLAAVSCLSLDKAMLATAELFCK